MITGKLGNGFEYSIEDDAGDNWELLEAIREADKGNSSAVVDVANLLLGEEQKNKLVKHLKKSGKVKVTDMLGAIEEIMRATDELKN